MREIRALQVALAAIALVMLAVVGYYISQAQPAPSQVSRTPGRLSPTPTPSDGTSATPAGREVIIDFSGSRYDRDQRLYTYGARRAVQLEDGGTEFDGEVHFDTQVDDNLQYRLRTDFARVSQDWKYLRATGGVRIERSDGGLLTSDWAEHYEREKAEVVGGNVRAYADDRALLCDRAEYRANTDEYLIDGNIISTDSTGVASMLTTSHLRYVRGSGQIFASHGVTLTRPGLGLRGDQLELAMNGTTPWRGVVRGSNLQQVDLESWLAKPDCGEPQAWLRRTSLPGLEIIFDPTGSPQTLRPYPSGTTVYIEGLDPPMTLWSVVANSADVTLGDGGRVESVTAYQVLWQSGELHTDGDAKESWFAGSVQATFDAAGQLGYAELDGGLRIQRKGEVKLTGKHGIFRDDVLLVNQDPVLESDRSTLRAKRLEVIRGTNSIRARGEVQVESKRGKVAAGILGSDGDPIRIRAEEMDSTAGGEEMVYRGQAQAWSGRDLLTADQIHVDRAMTGIRADGSVVMLLNGPGGPVEARANSLVFSGASAQLTGEVSIESPDLSLHADQAVLHFASGGGGVDVVDATGNEVVARRLGRTTYSHRLHHEVSGARTILYGGDKMARITTAEGHEGMGDVLTLWSEGNRVHIGSSTAGFAQTRVDVGGSGAGR